MLTVFTLNISGLHLGRPAYAWRALKMWRRSWLSREVLLFGLFFAALSALTAASWLTAAYNLPFVRIAFAALQFPLPPLSESRESWPALASILFPARPAWNTPHTPIDFILSTAFLGCAAVPVLFHVTNALRELLVFSSVGLPPPGTAFPVWPLVFSSALWMINLVVRTVRFYHSGSYERRASSVASQHV